MTRRLAGILAVFLSTSNLARAGQLEFDGVPVDITTAANEDLVIAPGEGGNTQVGDKTGTNSNATTNDDLHITGILEVDGASYFDGSVTLGDSTSDDLTLTGRLASNLVPKTDSGYNLGSTSLAWANLFADIIASITGNDLALAPASGSALTAAVTRSAATGNETLFDLSGTVNKATSGNYTGLKLNVTETSAPGSADKLADFQVGGISRAQVYNGTNSANYGMLSVGTDDWDGSTAGFFAGSASGTIVAVNAISGFTGNLIDLQVAGTSVYKVDASGNITTFGTTTANANLDMSNFLILNIGNAGTDFTAGGGLTLAGALAASGNTTLGDASGDTITFNAATLTLANDTAVTLSGGVDGINFDANTLSIDAANNRVGIGTAAPSAPLHVTGECVTGDTLLLLEGGKTLPIREVKGGEKVYSLDEETGQIVPARINGLLDKGVQPVFKLTTASGRSIKTTGNHPYLVKLGGWGAGKLGAMEWRKAADLKVGQEIAAAGNLNALAAGMVDPVVVEQHDQSNDTEKPKNTQHNNHLESHFTSSVSHALERLSSQPAYAEAAQPRSGLAADHGSLKAGQEIAAAGNLSGPTFIYEDDASIGIVQRQSKPPLPIREPTQLSLQTFQTSFFKGQSASMVPTRKNTTATMMNAHFIQRDEIFPNTPPNVPAITNAWKSVKEVLDNASSRFVVQNVLGATFSVWHALDGLSSQPAYAEAAQPRSGLAADPKADHGSWIMDRGANPSSILHPPSSRGSAAFWDRIASIEYIGLEHVYDIEVEGTHNFVANGIIAHNTYLASSSGNVGIGTTSPSASLDIVNTATAGGLTTLELNPGAHTAMTAEVSDLSVAAHTDTITGGYATQRFNLFGTPTITAASALTVTNADTLNIAGRPTAAGSAVISGASALRIPVAPHGSANVGLVSLGSGPWDGSTAGFFAGSASGTVHAINAATGYAGNLVDWQVAGSSKFKVDASGNLTVAGTQTFTGNQTITGNLSVNGNTTLGDASGDTITFNAATLTLANDTAVTLSGGVDGINFDANTLSIDAANNRVGIGTAAPSAPLHVTGECVTGDTLLSLADGRKLPIREVQGGERVYSLDEDTGRIVPARINGLLDKGVQPVFRLTTVSGCSIRTTGNHPYWVRKRSISEEKRSAIAERRAKDVLEFVQESGQRSGREESELLSDQALVQGEDLAQLHKRGLGQPSRFQVGGVQQEIAGFGLIRDPRGDGRGDDIPLFGVELVRGENDGRPLLEGGQVGEGEGNQDDLPLFISGHKSDHPDYSRNQKRAQRLSKGRDPQQAVSIDAASPSVSASAAPDLTVKSPSQSVPAKVDFPSSHLPSQEKDTTSSSKVSKEAAEWTGVIYLIEGDLLAVSVGTSILWDRIASIEYAGTEHVYDIEVEGTHNFVAGHFIEKQEEKVGESGSWEVGRSQLPNFPTSQPSFFGGIIAHNTYLATSSGNVGIGTTAPTVKLHVVSSSTAYIANDITGAGNTVGVFAQNLTSGNYAQMTAYGTSAAGSSGVGGINAAGVAELILSPRGAGAGLVYTNAALPLVFGTNSTERVRIDSTGNVGIGTTAPSASLDIVNTATSGGLTTLELNPGAHTAMTAEVSDFSVAAHTDTITGGYATQRFNLFGTPTITAASVLTVTNADTVNIAGRPTAAGSAVISGASALRIPVAPHGSANVGLVSLGSGPWDGSTAGFFAGSSSGTVHAINAASGYAGNLVDWQVAGSSKFKVDASGNLTVAGTQTFTGNQTITGNLSVNGNTTLGDASGDTVTFNAATVTLANDTNFALSGGVDGINFDANTLSIDATNNRVGIGTAAPTDPLHVNLGAYGTVLRLQGAGSTDTTMNQFFTGNPSGIKFGDASGWSWELQRATDSTTLFQVNSGTGNTYLLGGLTVQGSTALTMKTNGATVVSDGADKSFTISGHSSGSEGGRIDFYGNSQGSLPGHLDLRTGSSASANLRFFNNTTERMRITATGLVGIGTTSPSASLDIVNAATSGGLTTLELNPGAHTAMIAEVSDLSVAAHTDTITGGYATQRFNLFGTPTITAASALTVTNADTLNIAGRPTAAGSAVISGASALRIPVAPHGSANVGLVSLGSGPWDGSTAGFFAGSASGTVHAINAASGYAGNLVDWQVAGSSKFKVDASGNLTVAGTQTFTGNQTITGNLSVNGNTTLGDASGDTITFNAATLTLANDTAVILSGGVNGINFDSNTLSIDATNDRVGIGTAAPDSALEVAGKIKAEGNFGSGFRMMGAFINTHATGDGYVRIGDNDSESGTEGIDIGWDNNTNYGFIRPSNDTDTTKWMSFNAGNVGIGTTAPSATLHIVGSQIVNNIQSSQASFYGWNGISGSGNADNAQIQLGSNGSFMGILRYTGSTDGSLYIDNSYNNNSANIFFRTKTAATAVNALTILGSGSVGIGQTSPSASLDIVNTATSGGLTTLELNPGAHTAMTAEVSDFSVAAHTDTITGGYATQRFNLFGTPTITAASVLTVTNADTVSIAGRPTAAGSAVISGASALRIPVAPHGSANVGLVSLGSGPWDGVTAGFFAGSASGTVHAINAASGYAGNLVDWQVAGSSKFKVDASGNLTVAGTQTFTGNQTITGNLSVNGNTTLGDASGDTITFNAATLTLANDTNVVLSGGVNGISFDTDTLSIDATNDRVGIGTTSPAGRVSQPLEVVTAGASINGGITMTTYSADVTAPNLDFQHSRSNTKGTHSIVASGDQLGGVVFLGSDGTAFRIGGAILGAVDGTPGASDMPGRLTFSTTPDGSATASERMRIDNAGNVGIGTTSPAFPVDMFGTATTVGVGTGGALRVFDTTSAAATGGGYITLSGYVTGTTTPANFAIIKGGKENGNAGDDASYLTLYTHASGAGQTEQMRITSTGNVGIGTTSPAAKLHVYGSTPEVRLQASGAGEGVNLTFYDSTGTTKGKLWTPTNTSSIRINDASGDALILNQGSSVQVRARDFGVWNYADTTEIFTVKASGGNVGIGTTGPSATLDIVNAATSGGLSTLELNPGAHTAMTAEVSDLSVAAHTDTITGGFATQRFNLFGTPTITAASVLTVTNADTLNIAGRPTAAGSAVISGASALRIPVAPHGSANVGLVSLGSGPWDGSTAGFFAGSASGTVHAINAASGYAGNLVDWQVAGSSKFKVDASGNLTVAGTQTFTGNQTITGNLSVNGNTTLGDASGDTVTVNANTLTFANGITITDSSGSSMVFKDNGGVNILNNSGGAAAGAGIYFGGTQMIEGTRNIINLLNITGLGTSARTWGLGRNTDGGAGVSLTINGGNSWTTADLAGGDLILAGGTSTGTGAGGVITFKTAPTGSTGTTENSVAERMRITAAGNVGIGTTSPTNPLVVRSDVNSALPIAIGIQNLVTTAGATNGLILIIGQFARTGDATPLTAGYIAIGKEQEWTSTVSTNDAFMRFFTVADNTENERMRITSSGNVGIGTAGPTGILHLKSANPYIRFQPSAAGNQQAGLVLADNTDTNKFIVGRDLNNNGTNDFFIYDSANSVNRFYLNASGNVGIGTTAPAGNGVGGTPTILQLHNAGTSVGLFSMSNTDTASGAVPGVIDFVSTGLSAADKRLAEIGAIKGDALTVNPVGSLMFATANGGIVAERVRITNTGNVGIGTTGPGAKLHVDTTTTTDKLIIARGAASHTGNLFEAQNSAGTAYVTVGPPTLANDNSLKFFSVSGTLPSVPTAAVSGIDFTITTAGSAGNQQKGITGTLAAGYTGAQATYGIQFLNRTAGTETNWIAFGGNIAIVGDALKSGSNAGAYVGNGGAASGGSTNIGMLGAANFENQASQNNIGVVGVALNSGASAKQLGGYFGLQNATPTFASAALMADNGGTTSDIFVARDNGTAVVSIIDGGNVGIGTTGPENKLHVEDITAATYSSTAFPTGSAMIKKYVNSGLAGEYASLKFQATSNNGNSNALGSITLIQLANNAPTSDFAFTLRNVGGTYGEVMRIQSTGNVGIGTTAPSTLLHVGLAGTTLGTIGVAGNTSGLVTIRPAAAAGTWTLTLPTAVGAAGQQLTDAAGDGITSWAAASSKRETKNILGTVEPQEALSAILGTPVYRFKYKPGFGTGDYNTEYVGVMADEAPWAVHFNGTIVNPVNTLGYAVLGIQALQGEIEGLKKQNADLANSLKEIKARLEAGKK